MPELPDVEVLRKYACERVLNKRIKSVKIHHTKILDDISEDDLKKNLEGNSFTSINRYGKYIFIHSEQRILMMHFGMTGSLIYFERESPAYNRFQVVFDDNYNLAYLNKRLLGKIGLIESEKFYIEKKELGPDALGISLDTFIRILRRQKGNLKTALMDQKNLAGIGNIYSDEILFQAHFPPMKRVSELKENELNLLYNKMKLVFEAAIKSKADSKLLPHYFLIPHRKKSDRCPVCNGKVMQLKISGRSSYYCPKCQKD